MADRRRSCERIGKDWSEIASALKFERRIGIYSYLATAGRSQRKVAK
jgi:hypothetical protein